MKKIKITVAYDGTAYVGWQIQKNGLAVEQVLNEHLSRLLKENIVITGASRTDSGVHAMGNVASFYTETRIAPEKISLALNQGLPDDIKIVSSCEVPDDFHPRYADCVKTYQYNILNSRYNVPTLRLYYDYIYYPMDVDLMRKGAHYLVGEHDFTAFSSSGGQQKSSVRNILDLSIECEWLNRTAENENVSPAGKEHMPKLVHINISGNGFLYNMVRIIAGTLEKVGMGVYPPEYVREILESRDRRLSAPKAPARGLTLMGIKYN